MTTVCPASNESKQVCIACISLQGEGRGLGYSGQACCDAPRHFGTKSRDDCV